jgi:hypothetical protein
MGISSLCSYFLPVEQKEALEPGGRFGLSPEEILLKVFFNFFMYVIQQCFICHPPDSTVSEDAGTEPRTVVT